MRKLDETILIKSWQMNVTNRSLLSHMIEHRTFLLQMHAVMPIQIATKMSAVMEQTSKMHSTISLHKNVSTKCTSIRRPVPPFAQATIAVSVFKSK